MTNNRLKLIKIIHVARRELGMDRETYMQMVRGLQGLDTVESTSELSVPNLNRVLDALKKRGFKVVPNTRTQGKPHNFESRSMPNMITKIEALLADMALPWSYADAIAQQMFGIERCSWVRQEKQLKAIIAALHNRQRKYSSQKEK